MEIRDPQHERDNLMPEIETQKVADGIGYGEGNISHQDRAEIVGEEIVNKVVSHLNSNQVLVAVDKDADGNILDDDGCGDGRGVKEIFQGFVRKLKSLNRSKVFGGGQAMAASSMIGLGEAQEIDAAEQQPMNTLFARSVTKLKQKLIGFGGHKDTHAHGKNCGCGAIDKAPEIVDAVVRHQDNIAGTIAHLEGATTEEQKKLLKAELSPIFQNFANFNNKISGKDYSGKQAIGELEQNGKVVKTLDDNHKEMFIVLNDVDGYTVDQGRVREISDDQVQVFAVDVWRMKSIAERLYKNDVEKQRASFLSQLVYTLGVAAVLTKGDLPVYGVTNKQFAAAA